MPNQATTIAQAAMGQTAFPDQQLSQVTAN